MDKGVFAVIIKEVEFLGFGEGEDRFASGGGGLFLAEFEATGEVGVVKEGGLDLCEIEGGREFGGDGEIEIGTETADEEGDTVVVWGCALDARDSLEYWGRVGFFGDSGGVVGALFGGVLCLDVILVVIVADWSVNDVHLCDKDSRAFIYTHGCWGSN